MPSDTAATDTCTTASAERARLDFELSPSLSAKDAAGVMAAWVEGSEVAKRRRDVRVEAELAYGPDPRHRLDIWAPPTPGKEPSPVVIFLHGGFWQRGSKEYGGFAGPALAKAGCVYVAAGYRLAPDAPLRAIVDDVAAAIALVRDRALVFGGDSDRIVLAGHSAGAHLAATMLAGPRADIAECLAGVVLVSGVFDLAPIAMSYVNDRVGMSPAEIADLSPALHVPRRDVPVAILVGAEETAEFKRQSRLLERAWARHVTGLTMTELPGRDHFDILTGLAEPNDPLFRCIAGLAAGSAP